jgi:hypothetical protein
MSLGGWDGKVERQQMGCRVNGKSWTCNSSWSSKPRSCSCFFREESAISGVVGVVLVLQQVGIVNAEEPPWDFPPRDHGDQ